MVIKTCFMKNFIRNAFGLILTAIVCLFFSPNDLNACTQSHVECTNGQPGLSLICGGPTAGTCFAGGCGEAVIIVKCRDDQQ